MMFLVVLDIDNRIPVAVNWSFLCIEYMNRNSAVMDQKSIRQCKADQARILEQFKVLILQEFGAENMLSYEQVGRMFLEIVSGSFIISKWKAVVFFSIF